MKTTTAATVIVGLIAALAVTQASAADRYFQIQVKFIAGGTSPFYEPPDPPGPNCYSFLEDGTWIDPLFTFSPMGTWEIVSAGAVTRYTARAALIIPGVVSLVLDQRGLITPGYANGTVRLQAFSTFSIDGEPLAEFMSTGYETDGCP